MNRDYPALRAADYGGDAAGELVRSGRVALFLDGLDEMPSDMRALALQRINEEARRLRVVVTSRPLEYQLASQAARPDNIAVIEMRPVRPEAAAAYLLHGQAGQIRQRWQLLGAYLKHNPDSVAAAALDNPLTLSLARDAYSTGDPAVLTDPGRFPKPEAITDHLMDQFLIAAYPGEQAHAIRWLAWIAWHMGSSQDFQWWDIPSWVPQWKIRFARGLATGLTAGLTVTIAAGLTYARTRGLTAGFVAGLKLAVAVGIGIGLLAGLVTRLGAKPAATAITSIPVRRPRKTRTLRKAWQIRAVSMGLAVSLVVGAVAGLANGVASGVQVALSYLPLFGGGALLIVWLSRRGALRMLSRRRTPRTAQPPTRTMLLERPFMRTVTAALILAVAYALGAGLTTGPGAAGVAAFGGFESGLVIFGIAFGFWRKRGFGLAGGPQVLTFRWPQQRWLTVTSFLLIPLFPLLVPFYLNYWANPVSNSPSATAMGTYWADRRTSMTYAYAYAVVLAIIAGLLAGIVGSAHSLGLVTRLLLGFGWALAVGLVAWLTAWLAAGQVALVHLTQLILTRRNWGRVHFAQLLSEAHSRQVLRQVGAAYQFRHAELQSHLARMHREPTTVHSAR